MILVTVGTQFPFDRLVKAVDEWAGRSGRTDVFAQTGPSSYTPRYLQHRDFITPAEFARHAAEAQLIVSHAGMGSILNALELGVPILVMPRLSSLGEHRNDHQLSTAHRFRDLGKIQVAMDERELAARLDAGTDFHASTWIGPYASDGLIACLRAFIEHGTT